MFADRAKITIRSGKGGDGHVSFRRELYVAAGGPDGGDGGKGGDIIFEVDKGLNALTDFRHIRKYVAEDGQEGGKKRCHGADGEDLVIKVPEGTVLYEYETGKVIMDMSGPHKREVILEGGRGGLGNMHYATSTMQVPQYAKAGQPAKELTVMLELKVIADVGLIGFPNVGKSTFLSRVSNARPEVANYHFTTLSPHLGVVDYEGIDGFVIADIPGLIKGAADGAGLGHDFLRHIERCKVLLHLVDAASTEGRDPVEDILTIHHELSSYNPELMKRPQIIVANKLDAFDEEEQEIVMTLLKEQFEPMGYQVYGISAVSGQGMKKLLGDVKNLLATLPSEPVVYESEYEYSYDAAVTLPYTVTKNDKGEFVVEGPRIEKMLGYTNLETEKGFMFFQTFLKKSGILKELEDLGIEEGDTVRMYGLAFDYFK